MIISKFKDGLFKTVHTGEIYFDKLKFFFRKNIGLMKPLKIEPFLGYANSEKAVLHGRVLENQNINPAKEEDTLFNNFEAAFKRFNTAEAPGVELKISIGNSAAKISTDDEGYFDAQLFDVEIPDGKGLMRSYQAEIVGNPHGGNVDINSEGEFIVPPLNCEFGVISDIDDTIIKSDVTNFFRMIRLTFFNNARTRVPFPGVSEFYRALQEGKNGEALNPIFYVSNSPWNLYDLLKSFLDFHDIPAGPLLLRDIGIDKDKFISFDSFDGKVFRITKLLKFYPDLKFILIGDSGEQDPEIYDQICTIFPDRIKAIYIRDVTFTRKNALKKIAKKLKKKNIEFLVVKDSKEAAEHAVEIGLIKRESLSSIKKQTNEEG